MPPIPPKVRLDQLREDLCAQLRRARALPRCHARYVASRRTLGQLRALDAVRRAANDAEVTVRLWEQRAERMSHRILAGGTGRW